MNFIPTCCECRFAESFFFFEILPFKQFSFQESPMIFILYREIIKKSGVILSVIDIKEYILKIKFIILAS